MESSPGAMDIEVLVAEAGDVARARGAAVPAVAITLGSGLGGLADAVDDAVSIPTAEIPVTVAARLGARAASLSTITNRATGLSAGPLSHQEVTEAAGAASARLRAVLDAFLEDAGAGG